MQGFFQYYFNITDDGDEHAVCCPFPHQTSSGLEYFETHPSAHVNLGNNYFTVKYVEQGIVKYRL